MNHLQCSRPSPYLTASGSLYSLRITIPYLYIPSPSHHHYHHNNKTPSQSVFFLFQAILSSHVRLCLDPTPFRSATVFCFLRIVLSERNPISLYDRNLTRASGRKINPFPFHKTNVNYYETLPCRINQAPVNMYAINTWTLLIQLQDCFKKIRFVQEFKSPFIPVEIWSNNLFWMLWLLLYIINCLQCFIFVCFTKAIVTKLSLQEHSRARSIPLTPFIYPTVA